MHFLTEDDVRARSPHQGSVLRLAPMERLTPSALEYVTRMRIALSQDTGGGRSGAVPQQNPETEGKAGGDGPDHADASAGFGHDPATTHLDAVTRVPKNHPRIALRGKLDTLLAAAVLVQTQFDPENRLSDFLKICLGDIRDWIFRLLTVEISGEALSPCAMGGMNEDALHAISRDPKRYLQQEHYFPDASAGGNAALINWLRSQAREVEVGAVALDSCRKDIMNSLNRLSSAVYVLLLLTLAAEKGRNIRNINPEKASPYASDQ